LQFQQCNSNDAEIPLQYVLAEEKKLKKGWALSQDLEGIEKTLRFSERKQHQLPVAFHCRGFATQP